MRINAYHAAFLAAIHLLAAVVPCPSSQGGAVGVHGVSPGEIAGPSEHAAQAGHELASDEDSHPCHSEADGEVRANCPCGCGDANPGQDPVRSALAKSLFAARLPSLTPADRAPAALPELTLRARHPDEIDHVPIAA